MPIDRKIYFDSVRASLFQGGLSQSQVDGQNYILDAAHALVEKDVPWLVHDMRHLAYCLATTYHETSKEMQPIEEYDGADQPYGQVDPQTGQRYFGRGFVQLTHRDNYRNATTKLGLTNNDNLEWHAERALDGTIASDVMFMGMEEGWFRSDSHGKQTLTRYFNDGIEDAYGAREIINGDKSHVPDWSNGVSIGKMISGYYSKFLSALNDAYVASLPPEPAPEPIGTVTMAVTVPDGVGFTLTINGKQIHWVDQG